MTTVYLALGSNVGDPAANIARAIELLAGPLQQIKAAPLYLSKAVGYTDQPDFVNTAVSGQTDLAPAALLERLQQIEQQVGRTPTFRHGPREIDIDLIFYGDQVVDSAALTVPHASFGERDFVLQPLVDLNPDLTDPATGQSVAKLLAQLAPEQKSIIGPVQNSSNPLQ